MTIPFITTRNRTTTDFCKRGAFCKLVESLPHTVTWKKFLGDVKIPSMGDSVPSHDAPIAIKALVEHEPTKETRTAWSIDEREKKMIFMLTEDAISLGLTNRDRIIIDGVEHQIKSHELEEGMGHEQWLTPIALIPQDQTP